MIAYSNPFRRDKDIGKAYNDFIASQPDDAWIVLQDGDMAYLTPNWGQIIEDAAVDTPRDFGLLGCMTNRLGGLHQCYNHTFSNDMNIVNHYEIAIKLENDYWSMVEETTGVAGLFMMFHKDIWKEVGGFKEGTIYADTEFNKSVRQAGFKIGIIKGLYVFHVYRIWEKGHKAARKSVGHLL